MTTLHPSACYFYPLGPAADAAMEAMWARLTMPQTTADDDADASAAAAAAGAADEEEDSAQQRQQAQREESRAPPALAPPSTGEGPRGGAGGGVPCTLPVLFGRRLEVRRAVGGVAWFAFEELCGRPLGPADYVAVATAFHTVFVAEVPAMSMLVSARMGREGEGGR